MGHHLNHGGIFFSLPCPSNLNKCIIGYDVRTGQNSSVFNNASGTASGFLALHLPWHIIIVLVTRGIDLYHSIPDVLRDSCESAGPHQKHINPTMTIHDFIRGPCLNIVFSFWPGYKKPLKRGRVEGFSSPVIRQ
jgi:hypothetical protein